MGGRIKDLAKGLGALGALVLLVVGPPWALSQFVGWPLPTTVPSPDALTTGLRGGIDDMTIVKALAVLAWLCWAQITLAAMVEMTAVTRGRAAHRAPVLSGVQVAIGRLVASTALVLASWGNRTVVGPLPVAHLAALIAEPAPAGAAPEPASSSTAQIGAPAEGTPSPANPGRSYVVKRNDSWWAIAERTLGDGQGWRSLRDANVGRAMPDGSVISTGSELIRPGWELVLPEERVDLTHAAANGHVEEVEVRAGDNLWVMAENHLQQASGAGVDEDEVRRHWETVIDANRDRFAQPGNPSRIYPGQMMRMPAVDQAPPPAGPPAGEATVAPPPVVQSPVPTTAPVPARPELAPPTTATTSTTAASTSVPSPAPGPASVPRPGPTSERTEDRASDADAGVPAGLLGTASTALAVGIAAALTRRRRRRQAQLPPRVQPPYPPPELDELRTAVVVNGDVDRVTRLHRALRDVATALGGRRTDARPRLVQMTGSRIEVLLSHAVVPPPKPWRAEASGLSWELKGDPLDEDDNGISPTPALVSIGREGTDTELYLDLEAEGVVSLIGGADAVADVARSWILELSTSAMANGVSVVVVGKSLVPAEDTSDRFRSVRKWDEVEADALAWCEQSAALLKAKRWGTPVVGRLSAERADDLAPLIVFAEGVSDKRLRRLADAVLDAQGSVVLVVVGNEITGALRVEVGDGQLAIPTLGLTCQAQAIPKAVAEQVDELLEDAARVPAQLTLMPVPSPEPPIVIDSPDDEYHDPPFDILVRVLGDISVIGVAKALKPKQVAVLAYIALNAPVSTERVQDALWVNPTVSRRRRLANTVSETRGVLGAANLPISVDGRYRVGPGVMTDADLFDRRLAYAAQQDDAGAVVTIRGALEMVDGPVFTYRNVDRMSYVWVDIDNWFSTWELKVTDTAEELAQRYLDLGDPDGAVWAARRGLSASQTHARLTRLLIAAHTAGGDELAAERVLQSHRAVMEKLDLDDELEDLDRLSLEAVHTR